MKADILVQIILPIALFLIMFGMGMGLRPSNFKEVLNRPKGFAIGLSAQLFLLPILCLITVSLFPLDPAVAAGLLILSFCPSGTTSNIYSKIFEGDVALSISLTAVISIITPFTIPLLTHAALQAQLGESSTVTLPIVKTILQLIIITLIPVVLGMVANHFYAALCQKLEKPFKIFSIVFLFIIIAGIVSKNWATIHTHMLASGPIILLFNVAALICGYAIAKIFGLRQDQAKTIGFEVGIQNGTTALLVTGTLLKMPVLTISPVLYSLLMFATGALFGLFLHWTKKN
jgi:BASS family bile acid:Na+ symporter